MKSVLSVYSLFKDGVVEGNPEEGGDELRRCCHYFGRNQRNLILARRAHWEVVRGWNNIYILTSTWGGGVFYY